MGGFGGALNQKEKYDFGIIGIPYDAKSTFMKGPAGGPQAIRDAAPEDMVNPFTELGVDLKSDTTIVDLGDIDVSGNYPEVSDRIQSEIANVLERGAVPLVLGGDHSVTFPVVQAVAERYVPLDILHFDAHPDLYDEFDGDPYTHASPIARILDLGMTERIVQVGIRAATAKNRRKAAQFGVDMLEMKDLRELPRLCFSRPLYISFDMDALDPAFAPGVSHCEPGGLSTRQALHILHDLEAEIVGMDVVEVNPKNDVAGITAAAAAKLLMEVAGKIVHSSRNDR
jgi:agmatinase